MTVFLPGRDDSRLRRLRSIDSLVKEANREVRKLTRVLGRGVNSRCRQPLRVEDAALALHVSRDYFESLVRAGRAGRKPAYARRASAVRTCGLAAV